MLEDVVVRGHFGNAMRARRERLGYTQADIAAIAGVKQGAIAKWEARPNPPKNPVGLLALAAFFKVPLEDFMAGAIPATWLGIDAIEAPGDRLMVEGEREEHEGAIRAMAKKYSMTESEMREWVERAARLAPEARKRWLTLGELLEASQSAPMVSSNNNHERKEQIEG